MQTTGFYEAPTLSSAALAKLRVQTPGLDSAVHLNHAGGSLLPRASMEAVREHLALESTCGPMEAATCVADRLDAVRRNAATLINAKPDEIALTGSCSSGVGSFFSSFAPLQPGQRILVGRQEWGGNLATFERAAQRAGARVEAIPCRADGSVDAAALAAMIDERVRLISLTWLPANGGLINDAAAVGAVARRAGVPFFIDAAQALGQIPVDVRALQCDVLAAPGRKHLRGPRGTGLLYVRRDFLPQLDPAWCDVFSAPLSDTGFVLRNDVRRFETSEKPVALWLALGESIALALRLGAEAIRAEVARRADQLRARLAQVPGLVIHDLGEGARSGLVSFTLAGHLPSTLSARLAQMGIHISANGVPYTPLDMRARQLPAIARASVSYLTTDEDIERLADALLGLR